MRPMGDGDAGVGRSRDSRGNPGDHAEANPGSGQHGGLLPAAAEDVGVSPLEAHGAGMFAGAAHQQFVDLRLRQGMAVAALADVYFLTLRLGPSEHDRRYQGIIYQAIRPSNELPALEGHQSRVTGAGSYQVNNAAEGGGIAHQ